MKWISLLILLCFFLNGCGQQKSDDEALKNENAALKREIVRVKDKDSFGPVRLLAEAKFYHEAKDYEKSKNYLSLLFARFPESNEARKALDILFLIEDQTKKEEALEQELVYDLKQQKLTKKNPGYIALLAGIGGSADGTSLSCEIGKKKNKYLFGLGGSLIKTSDVTKTYYINTPGSVSTTNLGDYNEGDEYEIFGVIGKRFKEKSYIAGSLGYSWQKIVNLEKSNVTEAIYAASRKKKTYLSLSLQYRFIFTENSMLIFGLHSRRGLTVGLGIDW